MMSEPSRPPTSESGESMSSVEGFPAKTSVPPEREKESTESVPGCGPSLPGRFAFFDHASQLWRTFQLCLDGDCVVYSETWPRAGMTRNGIAYLLPPLVPLTGGTDFSLLPTPTANDAKNSTLPPSQRGRDSLVGFLMRQPEFPTPKASDGERGGRGELLALVRGKKTRQKWPTPTASDSAVKSGMRPSRATTGRTTGYLNETILGELNPMWVEWLMGFPAGWTDLEDSETPSSRKSQSGSDAD